MNRNISRHKNQATSGRANQIPSLEKRRVTINQQYAAAVRAKDFRLAYDLQKQEDDCLAQIRELRNQAQDGSEAR